MPDTGPSGVERPAEPQPTPRPPTLRRRLRALVSPSATPWYAVALMLGFLINAYSFSPVHPLAALRPLLLGVVVAAVLTVGLGLILRNLLAGGFVAAVLVGLLLGWGRGLSIIDAWLRQGLVLRLGLGIAALVAVAVGAWFFWRLIRRPDGWARLTYGLNVVGILFVAVGLVGAFRSGALPTAVGDLVDRPVATGPATSGAPNIWFIMLDEYARPDTLERVYGIDEGPFVSALEQRGFEVAQGNSANYPATPYNLMALFHMRQVPDIAAMAPVLSGDTPARIGNREAVNHNESFDLLRQHGYRIVTVAPPWEDVALRSADEYVDNGGINEFEVSLVERTALDPVVRNLFSDVLFQQERDRITFAFDEIPRLAEQARTQADGPGAQPRFTFVHVAAPHLPTVFGPNGEPTQMPYGPAFWVESAPQRGITREEFVAAYRGQLQYINTLIPPAVDAIIAHDPTAVVVVFGDEGSGVGMDWNDVPNSDLAERFSNLFSARTPGKTGVFAPAKTLVNVMPQLFNTYLGEHLPMQPDLHYAWRDGNETDLYLWEGNPG